LIRLLCSYTPISDIEAAVQWHLDLCEHLALKGRIRISPEGVNVVLDGGLSDLELFKASQVYSSPCSKQSASVHSGTACNHSLGTTLLSTATHAGKVKVTGAGCGGDSDLWMQTADGVRGSTTKFQA